MGDFLEKIPPSYLFKDFEQASAQFRKGNQGPDPEFTDGHRRLVGLTSLEVAITVSAGLCGVRHVRQGSEAERWSFSY